MQYVVCLSVYTICVCMEQLRSLHLYSPSPPPCFAILPEFISDEEDAEGDGYDHDKSVADLSTSLVINRDEFNQGRLPCNHQNLSYICAGTVKMYCEYDSTHTSLYNH